MDDQEARGKGEKILGRGKEIVGVITGDTALELEGDRQQAEGAAQEGLGKARRKLGELVDAASEAIEK